ncbi:MAG TPA: cobalamin biosynthesis protein CbiM [Actinobacteria bacterium]|nr:cobalamin biosynthesis protein CbiM [Actinomycetota bacterium]
MHIPDGFVDFKTAVTTSAFTLSGFIYSIFKVKQYFRAKVIVIMGVFAALIFAAQMINFTILGGTSGHLLGGALAAITLGPFAGSIIITAVLVIQAFIFGDGGIFALGANGFNMAIIGVFGAYFFYWLIKRISKRKIVFYSAVAFSSWISVVLASFFAALELGISGIYSFGLTLQSMVYIHMIIGLGEAAITTFIIFFIDRIRPELILTKNWENKPAAAEVENKITTG